MTADLFTPALEALLRANLTASALILLVFALRKPARRQFGARVAYGLWLLPLLGAAASLLPARTAAPVFAAAPPPAPAQAVAAPDLFPTGAATAANAATDALPAAGFQLPFDLMSLAASLWIAGAVFSLTWLVFRQIQFTADMRKGRAGPAVVGFIRPKVVLPDDFDARYDARERAVVLTHETTHLTRQDARIVALAALLRCLNWFNPLVHLAVFHLRLDQELACDAQVVQANPGVRRAYAETMLKAQMAARPLPLGCYWPSASTHPLTERITLLTAKGPSRLRALAGAGLVVFLGLGCGVAAWASKPAAPAAVIITPANLSPQDASDAALAARYARSRNLPLTQAPVQVGGLIRGLRDAGILDENLNPTGRTAMNLGGGKVSVDGEVRDGQLVDIAFNEAGQPVLKPVRTGKPLEIVLPDVERGKVVEVSAVATAPDGKTIRNQRRVSYDRMGSRGAYDGQNSVYVLGVETAQQGDGAKVAVTLWRDGKAQATGEAVLANGEDRSLTLSNGTVVKLHAAVRSYSPRQEARTPFQAESYAWTSTLAAEMAELKARQTREAAQRKRSAETRRRADEAERRADLARDVALEAGEQARASGARTTAAAAEVARRSKIYRDAEAAADRAADAARDNPTEDARKKAREARNTQYAARAASREAQAELTRSARETGAMGRAAGAAGRAAAAEFTRYYDPAAIRNFDPEAFGEAMGKWGEKWGAKWGSEWGKSAGEKIEKRFNPAPDPQSSSDAPR